MILTKSQSTVRSLVQHATKSQVYDELEAPIPGSNSGSAAFQPTTGEVNLYPDPATFETQNPRFYADCEGMLGAEPVAAQHQKVWWKYGRRYLIEERDGKRIDRSTAVKTIYPKFLYIFSDVICMVTRNQKSWADTAVRLLEWSTVGAYNAVNQYALPALIIILNAPAVEDQRWVSEDQDQATEDFFKSVEQEIVENETLREMAKKVCPCSSFINLKRILICLSTERRQDNERTIPSKLLKCLCSLHPS